MADHAIHQQVETAPGHELSKHAWMRMGARGLSPKAIRMVLDYGGVLYTRGAEIHAIGRKEVCFHRSAGIDLTSYEGLQVVCSHDGTILTAYRNRDFRGLRPRRPSRSRARAWA